MTTKGERTYYTFAVSYCCVRLDDFKKILDPPYAYRERGKYAQGKWWE